MGSVVNFGGVCLIGSFLAACQTTSLDVKGGVEQQLGAAGFTRVNNAVLANTTVPVAGFGCPKERCGAPVFLLMTSTPVPMQQTTGLTAEQVLKADVLKQNAAKALLQSQMDQKYPELRAQITSFNLNARNAQIKASIKAQPLGSVTPVYGSVVQRVRENQAGSLMVLSNNSSAAAKYTNPNWIP